MKNTNEQQMSRMRVRGYDVAVLVMPPSSLGELCVLGNAMFTKATQRRSPYTKHVWQMTKWWTALLNNDGYLPTKMVAAIWRMSTRSVLRRIRGLASSQPEELIESAGYYLSPGLVAKTKWSVIGWPEPERMDGLYLVPFPRTIMPMLRLELRSSQDRMLATLGEQLEDGWSSAASINMDPKVLDECAATVPPVVRSSDGLYHVGDVNLIKFNGMRWRKHP